MENRLLSIFEYIHMLCEIEIKLEFHLSDVSDLRSNEATRKYN